MRSARARRRAWAAGALGAAALLGAPLGTPAEVAGTAGPNREDPLLGAAPPSPVEPGRALVEVAAGVAAALEVGRAPGEALGDRLLASGLLAPLPDSIRPLRARAAFGTGPADASPDWRHGVFVLDVDAEVPLETLLAELRAVPGVRAAQPSFVYTSDLVPSDPHYGLQHAHALAQAETGWDLETGDPSVVIAVLGTGVERDHPDLAANLWENPGEIPGNGWDDDGNGFVDDRHGWDFQDGDADPSAVGSAHETAVAGVAAAVADNGVGIAGACWSCALMPVRIAYTTADVAAGIDYAVDNGAGVVNMSFGNYAASKYGTDSIVAAVVEEAAAAGVVLVATAGNDAVSTPRYPAALADVIAVAATDSLDRRADFSNFGAWIGVAAPGTQIHSTTAGGGYASVDGTSFAAPYVSGLAALLLSRHPELPAESVRRRILYSVDKLDTDRALGTGRVNLSRALALDADPDLFALIQSPRPDTTAPGLLTISGVALGDAYELAHRRVGATGWTAFALGTPAGPGDLGLLDTRELASGHYEIRLRSERGASSDEHVVGGLVVAGHDLMPGWPQGHGSTTLTSATTADLDGDGDLEVLSPSADGAHAWHHDGTPVAGWPAVGGGLVLRGALSVGDVDGDGDPEVVKLDYTGELVAWHHDGQPLLGLPRILGPQSRSVPVLGDVDGDGVADVVTSVYGGGSPARVDVLGGDGSPVFGWPVTLETNQQAAPALADLDGDGQPEILVHGWTTLYAFHAHGTPVAGWPVVFGGSHTSPLAVDLDGDGDDEVVAFGRSELAVFEGDGSDALRVALPGALRYATPALGDVDGDGQVEVCVGDRDGAVHLISLTSGAERPGWPVWLGDESSCSIADVDADPDQELLIAAEDDRLHAFDPDGSSVDPAAWPKSLGTPLFSSPTLGDLDGDGHVEVAAANQDGEVWVFRFADSAGARPAHWPTYQSGARHTGALALPEPGGLASLVCGVGLLGGLARRRRAGAGGESGQAPNRSVGRRSG